MNLYIGVCLGVRVQVWVRVIYDMTRTRAFLLTPQMYLENPSFSNNANSSNIASSTQTFIYFTIHKPPTQHIPPNHSKKLILEKVSISNLCFPLLGELGLQTLFFLICFPRRAPALWEGGFGGGFSTFISNPESLSLSRALSFSRNNIYILSLSISFI